MLVHVPAIHRTIIALAVILSAHLTTNVAGAAETVDFRKQVQPILAEHCYQCHGPDDASREAELRLDNFSDALSKNEIIVSGRPDDSLLVKRILSTDPDEIMPPPEHGKPLNQHQIEMLRKWVEEGGEYSKHWAFEVPEKAALSGAGGNPVDELVSRRLADLGLQLSPAAEPGVLCRRISLDAIGLPPSPAQAATFIAEYAKSPEAAVSKFVDQLLADPAYGEKWARHWLDVARYSDTNGFEKDLRREQWSWRDWVVRALNRDMPYDQFVVEQIAGDMLPERTQDQLIASGFLRNGMVNEEGAIVAEQFRTEGIFDRMDCIGKAFLGLSLQCAQCHSHKFDPITQDEYFGMFSFLNDVHEAQSWIYTPEKLQQIESIRSRKNELEQRIKQQVPDWEGKLNAWIAERQAVTPQWQALHVVEPVWEGGLNHPETLADESILILGHPTTHGLLTLDVDPQQNTIAELRLEALCHGDQPFLGPGRSYRGTFALSEIRVSHKAASETEWKPRKLASAIADFDGPERDLDEYFFHAGHDTDKRRRVGPASFLIDNDEKTGWLPDRGPVSRHTASVAVIRLEEALTLNEGDLLRVQIVMNHGGDGNGRDNLQLGRLRISTTDGQSTAPLTDHAATLAMTAAPERRSSSDHAALFRAWRKTVAELTDLNKQIDEVEAGYPEATTSILHVAQTQPHDSRPTRVLDRGEWNKPTREVPIAVPAALHSLDSTAPTRLDFAHWLASDKSPLTARVQVNRVWQSVFGRGLVETSEDFGTRASTPRQQDVLDWLAVDFMERGWSQKQVLKTILTSRVYAQSSNVTSELFDRDPYNELLARGPRFRADAEVVRDICLSVSGLLNRQPGGPSTFPPVPASVLDDNFVRPEYWVEATGPERYRRSLYMFRKRAMPDPVLSSFDSPNSDFACARRVRSNTPLAALVSLNEPIFVEAAQALALRVLREGGANDETRIDYAYQLCTSRSATVNETQAVLEALTEQRERLGEGWLSIHDVAFGKDKPRPDLPEHVSPRDAAAWTIVARVMLNLDETLTKN